MTFPTIDEINAEIERERDQDDLFDSDPGEDPHEEEDDREREQDDDFYVTFTQD